MYSLGPWGGGAVCHASIASTPLAAYIVQYTVVPHTCSVSVQDGIGVNSLLADHVLVIDELVFLVPRILS